MLRRLKAGYRRRGATTVEFAICFPVMLAIVFGTIEFARIMQVQHTIRLAAFEGARAGIALDASTADVQSAAQTILTAAKVKSATVTIAPNPLTYATSTVQVTVSADPASNAWLVWFVKAGHPISSTITLGREVLAVSVPGP
jgi:Flp pilus assembly protein TadG